MVTQTCAHKQQRSVRYHLLRRQGIWQLPKLDRSTELMQLQLDLLHHEYNTLNAALSESLLHSPYACHKSRQLLLPLARHQP